MNKIDIADLVDYGLDYAFLEIENGILIDNVSMKDKKIITDDMLYDIIMKIMIKEIGYESKFIIKYNVDINNLRHTIIDCYLFDLYNSLDINGQEKIKRIICSCLCEKNFLENGELDGYFISNKSSLSHSDLDVLFIEDKPFDYYYNIIREYNDEGLYIPNLKSRFQYSMSSLKEYINNLDREKYVNSLNLVEIVLSCIENDKAFCMSEQDYKKYKDANCFDIKYSVQTVVADNYIDFKNYLNKYLCNKIQKNSNFLKLIEKDNINYEEEKIARGIK